jgi:hypothetical protein
MTFLVAEGGKERGGAALEGERKREKDGGSLEEWISLQQDAADHTYSSGHWAGNPRRWLWEKYVKREQVKPWQRWAVILIVAGLVLFWMAFLAIESPEVLLIVLIVPVAALLLIGSGLFLARLIAGIQKDSASRDRRMEE